MERHLSRYLEYEAAFPCDGKAKLSILDQGRDGACGELTIVASEHDSCKDEDEGSALHLTGLPVLQMLFQISMPFKFETQTVNQSITCYNLNQVRDWHLETEMLCNVHVNTLHNNPHTSEHPSEVKAIIMPAKIHKLFLTHLVGKPALTFSYTDVKSVIPLYLERFST